MHNLLETTKIDRKMIHENKEENENSDIIDIIAIDSHVQQIEDYMK